MEQKVLIGTSGWGYDEWVGAFYPRGLTKSDFLSYYSRIYYTNEINTTFYSIPSKWVVQNWAEKSPSDFVFTAKLPKSITHKAKLDVNSCLDELDVYLKAMEPLFECNKLLAFLIQLPPSFIRDEHFGNLKEFIDNWPEEREERGYQLSVEFRDESWMTDEVFDYLRDKKLTYCAVIEPKLPPRMDITNPDFAYIRFHGYGKKIWFDYCFGDEEIKRWALKIENIIPQVEKIGIYFNNHFSGYAAKNSLIMMRELGVEPRNDPKSVKILDIKKESGTFDAGQTSLDKFF